MNHSPLLTRHRVHWAEVVYWLFALAVFFLFPRNLSLATAVVIMALFALSLDLVMGFAGVVSMGHAVFFGIGAYGAGLISIAGHHEPITGAILAGLAAASFALMVGPVIMGLSGLPQIMVTLALNVILYEAGNKAVAITGGDDGLRGITLDPLFGLFKWTVFGQTSYLYALGWLFVLFLVVRCIVSSPFGVSLQGLRENTERMRFIGTPVRRQLVTAYVVSGFIAGIAGAVSAQTVKFVGLEAISVEKSIDGLVMLVLGGVGRLYGGLIGAPVYMLVHQVASEWNPFHWMFVIGGLLIVVVMFARGGILGVASMVIARVRQRANR
ncbi:MAG: branched-chain amino acid ABC transporter permease [Burkholderiales bacterium]